MLSELKRYLGERSVASLADIALHLDVEPEVARAMLDIWIGKGRVRALERTTACSGCDLCRPGAREIYCWIGGGDAETLTCSRARRQSALSGGAEGGPGD